jgi:DNA polymerase-3 subunit chi
MTRIDFYFNVADKSQALSDLLQSTLLKRRKVTILVNDEVVAGKVSVGLWQKNPESFLPNVLVNHTLALQTPVVIHWQDNAILQDDMLVNLTPSTPGFFSRFTHLVELVSGDEHDKISARERFKYYRDRGYEIKTIDHAQTNLLSVE